LDRFEHLDFYTFKGNYNLFLEEPFLDTLVPVAVGREATKAFYLSTKNKVKLLIWSC
jgi:hypothetical protein